jgi:hypothetical protein
MAFRWRQVCYPSLLKQCNNFLDENMPPRRAAYFYFKGRPVSRILSLCCILQEDCASVPSFIWARSHLRTRTTYPPARASNPLTPVYAVFQPIRCAAHDVTVTTGELLPHLFTIIRRMADCYFLSHYYTLSDIFPLGRMVLFVARTFLCRHFHVGNDGPACQATKLQNK